MLRWFLLSLLLSTLACSQRKEVTTSPIAKDKMVAILADIHLLEAQHQGNQLNEKGRVYNTIVGYEKIFHKHSVTAEQFYDAFSYYKNHPEEMDELYQEVIDQTTRDESKISTEATEERRKQSKSDTTQPRHDVVPRENEW